MLHEWRDQICKQNYGVTNQTKEKNLEVPGPENRIILIYILGRVDVAWINLAQKRVQWHHFMGAGINFRSSIKCELS